MSRICRNCNVDKPLTDYYLVGRNKCVSLDCKPCYSIKKAAMRKSRSLLNPPKGQRAHYSLRTYSVTTKDGATTLVSGVCNVSTTPTTISLLGAKLNVLHVIQVDQLATLQRRVG